MGNPWVSAHNNYGDNSGDTRDASGNRTGARRQVKAASPDQIRAAMRQDASDATSNPVKPAPAPGGSDAGPGIGRNIENGIRAITTPRSVTDPAVDEASK